MAKKTSTHDDRRGHFLAITPNYLELLAMAEKAARYSNPVPYVELIEDSNDQFSALPITSDLPKIKKAITTLLPKFSRIIVKLGSRGVVLVVPSSLKEPTSKSSNKFILRYLKPQNVIENCVSVTGAGDSMVGTIVSGLSQSPVTDSNKGNHVNIDKWTLLVEAGMRSSLLTIMSPRAVSDKITANVFAN